MTKPKHAASLKLPRQPSSASVSDENDQDVNGDDARW